MRTRKTSLAVACIGLIAAQTALSAAESVGVLLQKGIYAEEAEGDLEAAVQIYRGIVDQARQDQPLVAQALYRLGGCYLKQGLNAEAVSAYQTILKQFPEDPAWTSRARDELGALGQPASGVVLRQVWSQPKFLLCPSPDGRQVIWVDYEEGGDLMLRDLATGVDQNLTNKPEDAERNAFYGTFSPDGKRIAYGWADVSDPFQESIELKIMDLSDLSQRVLCSGQPFILTHDWSPDGRHLAVLSCDDPQSADAPVTLSLISTADGTERKLGTWVDRVPQETRFSPDGRYLAYNALTRPFALTNLIMITDVETGTHHQVDDGMNRQHLVGWAPDGQGIVFTSDRRGSIDLWQVDVKDAQVTGQPALLKSDLGQIEPVGMNRKGDLFYITSISIEEVRIAQLDFTTGKLLAAPRLVDLPSAASNGKANLSPDGNYLIYRSGVKDPVACRLDLRTWEVDEIKGSKEWASGITWWALAPDNRSLMVSGYDPAQKLYGFWILNLETDAITSVPVQHGEFTYTLLRTNFDGERVVLLGRADNPKRYEIVIYQVKTGELVRYDSPVGTEDWRIWETGPWISPDGHTLFSKRKEEAQNNYVLTAHNLETGKSKDLFETHFNFSFFMSMNDPEGRKAFVGGYDDRAKRYADWEFTYEDFVFQQVRSGHFPEGFRVLWGFTDIRTILLEKENPEGGAGRREVWILNQETGKLTKSELTPAPNQGLRARSRPGSQFIMLGTTKPEQRTLWALENLFPVAASTRK